MPQGSVLECLFFLLFINDTHKSISHGTLRHFADDTKLLTADISLERINKYVNYNLKLINGWLEAKKICLSASKTDLKAS